MPIVEFWIALGCTVLLTAAFGVCLLLDKRRSVWNDRRFPGTGRTNVLFGDFGSAGQTEHRMYVTERLYRAFKARKLPIGGAVMHLTPCVIVTDAKLIEHVLSDEFAKVHPDLRGMRTFRSCWDAFVDERFEDLLRVVTEESRAVAQSFRSKEAVPQDVKAISELFVVRTLARSLFGKKWNERHQLPLSNVSEKRPPNAIWNILACNLPYIRRMQSFLHLENPSLLEELVHSLEGVSTSKVYFLQHLKKVESMADKKDRLGFYHTKVLLQELVQNVFYFASGTIIGCLFELAHHPECQASLHDALKRSAESSVDKLDQVIGETLRKYPPVDEISFISAANNRLPGCDLVVPRHTTVTVPIYAIHRDAEHYPEPTRFNPTRPILRSADRPFPSCLYRPLGVEPLPVGASFATMLVRVGLANILERCTIRLTPESPVSLEMCPSLAIPYPRGKIALLIEEAR
uniref:Cytochrome P450 n=1 Tax=Anopheles atroparvus TaxID=41427 RepID=A0AAG5CVY3_ANOAO